MDQADRAQGAQEIDKPDHAVHGLIWKYWFSKDDDVAGAITLSAALLPT